jgi:hypothetical protein
LKTDPICCTETSVNNYDIAEEPWSLVRKRKISYSSNGCRAVNLSSGTVVLLPVAAILWCSFRFATLKDRRSPLCRIVPPDARGRAFEEENAAIDLCTARDENVVPSFAAGRIGSLG